MFRKQNPELLILLAVRQNFTYPANCSSLGSCLGMRCIGGSCLLYTAPIAVNRQAGACVSLGSQARALFIPHKFIHTALLPARLAGSRVWQPEDFPRKRILSIFASCCRLSGNTTRKWRGRERWGGACSGCQTSHPPDELAGVVRKSCVVQRGREPGDQEPALGVVSTTRG